MKDEECERLSKVRDQLGQELEELTASLFQVGLPLLLRLSDMLPLKNSSILFFFIDISHQHSIVLMLFC